MSRFEPSSVPDLRGDLEVGQDPQDPDYVLLRDPVSTFVHRLSPVAAAFAQCCNGHNRIDAICHELSARFENAFAVEDFLQLAEELEERLLLVDEKLEQRLAEVARLRQLEERARAGQFELFLGPFDAPSSSVDVRADQRHECICCGVCCSGRFRIELFEPDVQRLAALPLEQLGTSLPELVTEHVLGGDADLEHPRRFLAHRQGRCVLLGDDRRCRLHAHFGFASKPLGCRLFPYYPIATPDAAVLAYRLECSNLGAPSPARLASDELGELWPQIQAEMSFGPSLPEAVRWTAEQSSTLAAYLERESAWLDAIRVLGWRAGLGALASTLNTPAKLNPRRVVHSVFGLLVERYFEHELGEERGVTFEPLLPRKANLSAMFDALLVSLGLTRRLDYEQAQQAIAESAAVLECLPSLNTKRFDRLLDDYVLASLHGKQLFYGLTLSQGAGLLVASVLGARRCAAYAIAVHARPLSVATLREALVAWQLLLYNRNGIRARLLSVLPDDLEALSALPGDWR